MIDQETIFLEGHKELIKLMRWVSTPMMYVPRSSRLAVRPQAIEQGSILIGDEPESELKIVYSLPKEDVSLIIKTFCESHLRIK